MHVYNETESDKITSYVCTVNYYFWQCNNLLDHSFMCAFNKLLLLSE